MRATLHRRLTITAIDFDSRGDRGNAFYEVPLIRESSFLARRARFEHTWGPITTCRSVQFNRRRRDNDRDGFEYREERDPALGWLGAAGGRLP